MPGTWLPGEPPFAWSGLEAQPGREEPGRTRAGGEAEELSAPLLARDLADGFGSRGLAQAPLTWWLEPYAYEIRLTRYGSLGTADEALPEDALKLKTSFAEQELAGLGTLWHFKGSASFRVLGGTLRGDTELMEYSAFRLAGPNGPGEDRDSRRLVRMVLTGAWGSFGSGIEVNSIDRGFDRLISQELKSDQEGAALWLAWKYGAARVKASLAQLWDNVADDPHLARSTKTEAGTALELTLPFGPLVTLGYFRGSAEASAPPRPRQVPSSGAGRTSFEKVVGSLYYGGPSWDLSVSSTYSPIRSVRSPGKQTVGLYHDVTSSYRPNETITITPSLGLWDETDTRSGVASRTASASLWIAWSPLFYVFDFTAFGSYSRSITTDGFFDGTTINTATSLVWNLRKSVSRRITLSFEVGHNRYLDALYGSASYDETYGSVVLKITPL